MTSIYSTRPIDLSAHLHVLGLRSAAQYLLTMRAPQQRSKIVRQVAAQIETELQAFNRDLVTGKIAAIDSRVAGFQALMEWSRGDMALAAKERAKDVLSLLLETASSLSGTNNAICLSPHSACRLFQAIPAEDQTAVVMQNSWV